MDRLTRVSARRGSRIRLRHATLWIVLGWTMSLVALVRAPLVKAAQARAWCVARTMVETGDFAVPRYNGEIRLKKPPLQSWVQAGAMEAVGSTDRRVAGFASWVTGLLFALSPFLLGASLRRPFAGLLASLLLVTCRSAVVWGASPEHDVAFAGAIGVALACLARALGSSGRTRFAVGAGLCCGAAVLIKGPFALAFILGTALVTGGARRAREGELSRLSLWVALTVGSLAPAAIWLAVLFGRVGGIGPVFDELRHQALGESGAHLKSGLSNFVYYFGMIPKWAMPWSVLLLPMVGATIWRRRRGDRAASALPSFAVRSFLVAFVVLTLVPAKQEHYLLPALPAAFLVGACALENALRQRVRAARWIPLAVALLSIGFLAERVLVARSAGAMDGRLLSFAALAVAAAGFVLVTRRRESRTGLVRFALLAAFWTTAAATLADSFRSYETDDVGRSARSASERIPASHVILGFAGGTREAFDTTAAYLNRVVERVTTIEALRARLDGSNGATVLVERPEDARVNPMRTSFDRVAEIAPSRPSEKDRVTVYRARR